ncbi:helix-turn-helix domain-containing protein [Bacteroides ovatus]|uniref:helix-turn-helix domain-containing protein n=1 Tax=Bacteroides ovatus TaxID=28116 RepID=UPI0021D448A5|nr:helix-turn-helix domain-containing protein [Bacteroides ovatus]
MRIINGERYLTSEQVCKHLNITKRTLLEYREKGEVPYITLFGKMLYKESDLLAILKENYVPRF